MKKFFILFLLGMLLMVGTVLADIGDFFSDDSDWGGGSTWGGDYSWGDSSDWGSSSYDRYDYGSSSSSSWDWFSEDRDDYDRDYRQYPHPSFSTLGYVIFCIIVMIFGGIYLYLHFGKRKKTQVKNPYAKDEMPEYMPNYDGDIISDAEEYGIAYQLMQEDEFFKLEYFLAYVKIVFRSLQTAWTKKNLELIRLYENDDLFEQHTNQIDHYIKSQQTNVIDMVQIRNAELYSLTEEGDKNVLNVILTCSMLDYVLDDKTGKVIYGSKDKRINRMYLMTFVRQKGVQTKKREQETQEVECPNCGAKVVVTSKGECRYCGTLIRTDEYDWIISNIEPYRKK